MLFEAGAIARSLDGSRVVPYLIDVDPSRLPAPLAQFQAVRADRAGTHSLVRAISKWHEDNTRPLGALDEVFEVWWPKLQYRLKQQKKKTAKRKGIDNTNEISLQIRRANGQSTTITAPRDMLAEELVAELIDTLKLPTTDADGQTLWWFLMSKSTGRRLDPRKTLTANEISENDELLLETPYVAG